MEQAKMGELDPQQRQDYNQMSTRNRGIQMDIRRARMEIHELNNKVSDQDQKLRMDNKRMKIITLRNQL